VIFNVAVPMAASAHAGAALLVNLVSHTEIPPERLKLSIWRRVEVRDAVSGAALSSTLMNVQRFSARRPFQRSFDGTYFINVPKRCERKG